jgi:polyhydroxybutyrate depolymerase
VPGTAPTEDPAAVTVARDVPTPSPVATPEPTAPPGADEQPPATCSAPGDVLVTPSGRRVLLRAAGVAPASPLVLVLHGYTGTPAGIERFAELTAPANAASVAVAYPEGTPTPTEGFGWSSGAALLATSGVDDVAALAEMLDAIVATGCVDPARVVIAGESNGAGMALAAACDSRLAFRVAAVVLVNPAVDEGVLARCGQGAPRPLPLSVIAGDLDATVPYEGGRGLYGQEAWFPAGSWLLSGCEAILGPSPLDEFARVLAGGPCESCSVLFTVADGTHTWPGTSRGSGGLRPGTFDLNSRLLWSVVAPPPLPCLPW